MGDARAFVVLWLCPVALSACSLLVDTQSLTADSALGDAPDAGLGAAGIDTTDATSQVDASAPNANRDGEPSDDATAPDDAMAADANAGDALVDAGPVDAGSDAGRCPSGRGPAMVEVKTGANSYCIDRTEVTNGQYAAFLAASDQPTQDGVCAFNASYLPFNREIDEPVSAFPQETRSYPVVWVDWCDAQAFCTWAGKRLCGHIGGGSMKFSDSANLVAAEWGNACSNGATQDYAYGPTPAVGRCNDGTLKGVAGLVPVASLAQCVGGYPGLFDMAGNVEEWEDSCNGTKGATDLCQRRGGSFSDGPGGANFRCDTPYTPAQKRGQGDSDVGIRCCAD